MTGARTLFSRFRSIVRRKEGVTWGGADDLARREVTEKDEQLRKLRDQVGERDRELAHLQAELASADPVGTDVPVFFIVGRAKSGTSWLRSIMDSHPEVLCINEGRFFGRDYRGRGGAIPRSLYGALTDSEYLKTWVRRSPWSRGEDTEEHLRKLTRRVIDYFMAEKLAKTGKTFAGDKTPLIGMEVIAEIAEIQPDAKVIHIVRDGRDVAISSVHHIWNNAKDQGGRNDVEPKILTKRDAYREDPEGFLARGESIFGEEQLAGTARNWADLVGKASRDGRTLLGDNYVEVRYEDLLERPVDETRRLLRFLGADDAETAARRCVELTSFERMSKRKRGQEDSSSFFRKGVAGDWKAVFNDDDKRTFKAVAGDLLIELGYESDDAW